MPTGPTARQHCPINGAKCRGSSNGARVTLLPSTSISDYMWRIFLGCVFDGCTMVLPGRLSGQGGIAKDRSTVETPNAVCVPQQSWTWPAVQCGRRDQS